MENKANKRSRPEDSDDDNNNQVQRKVLVTQKISDARDPARMQEVHDRTTKMLFEGANPENQVEDLPVEFEEDEEEPGLHEHYQLMGDGTIVLRDMRPDADNPDLEREKSRCCQRMTFIHGRCINCRMDLCEECGYSCAECTEFICRSCVCVFNERRDDPLCERCQMFFD